MIVNVIFHIYIVKNTYFTPYLFTENDFWKSFSKHFCIYLLLKKLVNKKYFSVKEKFDLVSEKYFLFILDGKHFSKVVKQLKISYYLLIILNPVLKLLIVIYNIYIYIYIFFFFWFFFQFHPLKFDFYINFGPYFYNCYLLFPYHFLSIKFSPYSFDCYLFYLI
jgi:hypothetical protein